MVWDGMFHGKQERTKKIIGGENDWIIWDIRTKDCDRNMEIWIPKTGRSYSGENVEVVWDTWWNDDPQDECRVQVEGPEQGWWVGMELGLLRSYHFPGHVTSSDDSVGNGSMGSAFV